MTVAFACDKGATDGEKQPPSTEQCKAGETACGTKCCSAGELCDAQTSTCEPVLECDEGQAACGARCCAADERCDDQTWSCEPKPKCSAGESECGGSCCKADQRCNPQTLTCEAVPACGVGETACGASCCTAEERCNTQTSTCEPLSTPDQLERCYAPAAFGADAFASEPGLIVDEDGFEYVANHEVDAPFAQMLSIGLWPLSESTELEGTFDLSQEPLSYASCEHCVLVIAGRSAEDQKYYLARAGTLNITELGARRIAGSLANVQLAEVVIDEDTLATSLVEGGCELDIPSLSFEYGELEEPLDPHVERCFLPESFGPEQFRDFIYEHTANSSGYFYRAIELPAMPNTPYLELFVEVYREGTGSFSLAGAETNCASCYHFVIIDATARSGAKKTYVSSSGTLHLTELSDSGMVGRLENVRLVETEISGSTFTPVPNGCSTRIDSLEFSSYDAT
ncbi:MAG: hypothetical protein ACOX6T_16495 [Myxococcales bacterium]